MSYNYRLSAVIKTWSFRDKISYSYVLCKMAFRINFTEFYKIYRDTFLGKQLQASFLSIRNYLSTVSLHIFHDSCVTEYFSESIHKSKRSDFFHHILDKV